MVRGGHNLEEGYGDTYTFDAYPARQGETSRRAASSLIACFLVFGALSGFAFVGFQNAQNTVRKTAVESPDDGLCVAVSTTWANVLTFPGRNLSMTSVKMMSGSRETVYAAETLDLPGCVGKKIYRSRDYSITVRYVDAAEWPTGEHRYERYENEIAICVQHALDVFSGKINCNSN
jgi:hypothetical protein